MVFQPSSAVRATPAPPAPRPTTAGSQRREDAGARPGGGDAAPPATPAPSPQPAPDKPAPQKPAPEKPAPEAAEPADEAVVDVAESPEPEDHSVTES